MGMAAARGAATSRTTRSVSAWTMPATGVRAPDRMLVAVRAIAPVAGRPPTNGETRFATPRPTSSMLESWRSPLILSADLRRHPRLDRPRQADGDRGREEHGNEREAKRGDRDVRQAGRDPAEARAD